MIEKIILLSLLPISELRGAIPVGILSGMPWQSVLIVAVLSNFLVVPISLFLLDLLHERFYSFGWYKKLFDRVVERGRSKVEKHLGTSKEFWAFMLLVAIPLPMTGAYSATILGWFFNVRRSVLYRSIGLGLIIAGLIVTAITLGIF